MNMLNTEITYTLTVDYKGKQFLIPSGTEMTVLGNTDENHHVLAYPIESNFGEAIYINPMHLKGTGNTAVPWHERKVE